MFSLISTLSVMPVSTMSVKRLYPCFPTLQKFHHPHLEKSSQYSPPPGKRNLPMQKIRLFAKPWLDQIFFKIHIAELIQSIFWQAWLIPQILLRDVDNLLFQGTMGMPDMPDHTQEKLHGHTVASMDTLLHAKAHFLPQIGFEIFKLKTMCNLTGREHYQLQLKN